MPRPKLHDADLRERLLERAESTVAERGWEAVSLRVLAAAEGTSTTAVYSLFGGKPGLLVAVRIRALNRLTTAMEAAYSAQSDTLNVVLAVSRAYYRWALDNTNLYLVIFEEGMAGLSDSTVIDQIVDGRMPMRRAVVDACAAGELRGDQDTIVFSMWSTIHGAVMLTRSGWAPHDDTDRLQLLDKCAVSCLRGWMLFPVS